MADKVTRDYRSDRLQKAKEDTGKNNSVIARETGLSRPTVIAVVGGSSDSLRNIRAVAKCLNVSDDELFTKAA